MKYEYWIFLFKPSNHELKEVYAYTDDKSLKEMFSEQRNMKHFKLKHIFFTRGELNEFCDRFTAQKLEKQILHLVNAKTGKYQLEEYAMTLEEQVAFRGMIHSITLESQTRAWFPMNIFTKEMTEALNDLHYFEDILTCCDTYIDELACFVRLFSNTL